MHDWRELQGHPGSFARLSDDEGTRTAVIFVHGYYGGANGTWVDFQSLVDQSGAPSIFNTTDLYFYKYPSTRKIVAKAAEELAAFTARIFPVAGTDLFKASAAVGAILKLQEIPDVPRKGPLRYTDLVLVGHSMGGVLIREVAYRTVRYGYKQGPTADQIRRASVVLFGPAQAGFRLGDEIAQAMSFHGVLQVLYLLYVARRAKAYKDLVAESPVLEGIRSETIDEATKASAKARCFHAHTVWGANEWVVYVRDYPLIDTRRDPLPDHKGHTEVSKPAVDFPLPIDWVADGITRARQPL
jgi:pimeloyl-ACP methyl ester carboxylesterase